MTPQPVIVPEEKLKEALEAMAGNYTHALKWLKNQGFQLSYSHLHNLVDEANLRDYARSCKTMHAHIAYDKLMEKVEEGDLGAIQMLLRSQGKKADFIPEQTVLDYKHQLEMEKLNQENEQSKELLEAFKAQKQDLPHQAAFRRFGNNAADGRSEMEDE